MASEWIRRVGLIAVALFGLCVACVEPREPMEGSVPVSEGTRRDSEEAPETPAVEDPAPPPAGATVDAPCSGYPVDGTEGPYRLAAGSGIEPPKRARFEEPDARTLGLEMSDVPGPLLLEVVISKTGEVASVPDHRGRGAECVRCYSWLTGSGADLISDTVANANDLADEIENKPLHSFRAIKT